MTVSIPVEDARIIGAMAQPRSKSVFSRAALLVSNDDGVVLHAHDYGQAGIVSGPRLTLDEVRVLVATGQAIDLPRREILAVGAVLWILRPGFPRREAALADLSASGFLIHGLRPRLDGSWYALVDERLAGALRDRWRDEALSAAQEHGHYARWQQAEAEAEAAFTLATNLEPAVLAMLSVAYERTGRAQRSQGLFTMARRSRGDDFAAQMSEAYAELESRYGLEEATA